MAPHALKIVRIRNDGERDFKSQYDSLEYVIKPGQDLIVQWEAMCLWFGNPDAADIDDRRRFRTDEFRRLTVKYGVYEKHHMIDELFPKVSVFDLTTGTRLITVCEDPEGKHLTPEVQMASQNEMLKAQMEQMQAQMAMLMQQMAQANPNMIVSAEAPGEGPATSAPGDGDTITKSDAPELKVKSGPLTVPDTDIDDDEDAATDTPRGPRPVGASR